MIPYLRVHYYSRVKQFKNFFKNGRVVNINNNHFLLPHLLRNLISQQLNRASVIEEHFLPIDFQMVSSFHIDSKRFSIFIARHDVTGSPVHFVSTDVFVLYLTAVATSMFNNQNFLLKIEKHEDLTEFLSDDSSLIKALVDQQHVVELYLDRRSCSLFYFSSWTLILLWLFEHVADDIVWRNTFVIDLYT